MSDDSFDPSAVAPLSSDDERSLRTAIAFPLRSGFKPEEIGLSLARADELVSNRWLERVGEGRYRVPSGASRVVSGMRNFTKDRSA